MNWKRLLLAVSLGALFSACGAPGMGGPIGSAFAKSPVEWKLIKGVTGKQIFPNGVSAMCSVSEFEIPGQGFRSSGQGQIGGFGYATETASTTAGALTSSLVAQARNGTGLQSNVLLLVADHFEGKFDLGNEVFTQTFMDPATMRSLRSSGALTHGALVFRHLVDILKSPSSGFISWNRPSPTTYRFFAASGVELEVRAVDIWRSGTPADTTYIAAKIKAALGTAVTSTRKYALTNMSFALLPCEIFSDYKALPVSTTEVVTFNDYAQKIYSLNLGAAIPADTTYDDFVKQLVELSNLSSDPLNALIQDPAWGAKRFTYVASSGNYGLPVSMYPAAWNGVVNVTGSTVDNVATSIREDRSRNTTFFNVGEIMHVGATFSLPTPVKGGRTVYYRGTSFSAPEVSVFSAIDMMSAKRCASDTISKLAVNASRLVDKHVEDLIVGGVLVEAGAANILCR